MGTSQLLDKVCDLKEEEEALTDNEGLLLLLLLLDWACNNDKWVLGFWAKKLCGNSAAGVVVNAAVTQPFSISVRGGVLVFCAPLLGAFYCYLFVLFVFG